MKTHFVLASKEVAEQLTNKAKEWYNSPSQQLFVENKTGIWAIAEYLANEKGLTLYKTNATYPTENYFQRLHDEGIGTIVEVVNGNVFPYAK